MNYAADPAISDANLFSAVSKSLRKDSRSIHNRLCSIAHDSEFVIDVSETFGLPLVANERCGRWYIPPERIAESVYFKSTDGHTGQWGFSLRRLNLHIIDLVARSGGIVIVDSTRRGKRMPDALSKTIPIWCAVLNNAVFGVGKLYTSPTAVSASEHAQIEAQVGTWTQQFLVRRCGIDIANICAQLDKPLRPIWVTPDVSLILRPEPPTFDDFHAIVLCTASRTVQDGAERRQSYTYVQGAADDQEAWASGITPNLFWINKELLLKSSDYEVEEIVRNGQLKGDQSDLESRGTGNNTQLLDVTAIADTGIYIGKKKQSAINHYDDITDFNTIIDLSTSPTALPDTQTSNKEILQIPTPDGKKGSKQFRADLPRIIAFFERTCLSNKTSSESISSGIALLILCDTGSDFSVGAALSILSLYYNEEGHIDENKKERIKNRIDKDLVRRRLTLIVLQRKVNPSRATLLAVNSVLMGWNNN
ncbi:tRNA A64-2'-O-ribosylphosphate transferase [Lipomyces chichibuensis]|uniref:tRNA A64-2'-O-ribosylphosphate transferase n=1 Tax=Lipomyces chichibuensis TaxID=1546026 RepID=UPI003343BFDF